MTDQTTETNRQDPMFAKALAVLRQSTELIRTGNADRSTKRFQRTISALQQQVVQLMGSRDHWINLCARETRIRKRVSDNAKDAALAMVKSQGQAADIVLALLKGEDSAQARIWLASVSPQRMKELEESERDNLGAR